VIRRRGSPRQAASPPGKPRSPGRNVPARPARKARLTWPECPRSPGGSAGSRKSRPRAALRLNRFSSAVLTGAQARAVFPLLGFKDPAGLARPAVEGTPGGRPGRPRDREDDPDAIAPTAGGPVP
jgi:hypothetical protein